MTVSIIYKHETGYIDELCVGEINITQASALIPHVGETFIDRIENIEYEVKDIVRTFNGKEYLIQVCLRRREKNKYKM